MKTMVAVLWVGASMTSMSLSVQAVAQDDSTVPTTTVRRAPSQAEQSAQVRSVLQRASVLAQRISQMLEEARREADIIRVTCLNDKLTQVNANTRTAQTRSTAFENATTPEQRNHEATVISVIGQKFQVLDQEANRCVGQDLYDTGSTKVETEIDTAMLPFEEDVAVPVPPPPSAVPSIPLFSSATE
jgi:flagellar basal body L-ring protein FlgH